eukprot:jgi/Botrbrau1/20668/Bobra.0058s0002.1
MTTYGLLCLMSGIALLRLSAGFPQSISAMSKRNPFCIPESPECVKISTPNGDAWVSPVKPALALQAGQAVTAPGFDTTTACPNTYLPNSGISVQLIENQLEICMNDFRTNPQKYRTAVSSTCNWDTAMIPILPDGNRLPLIGSGTVVADQLDVAARRHSIDMATRNFFDHVNPDGQDPGARMRAAGWNPGNQGYTWGENIAAGYPSILSVMVGWFCSPGHLKDFMNCAFDTVGSGYAYSASSTYKSYYTQDFSCIGTCNTCVKGGPSPSPSPPPPSPPPVTDLRSPPPPPATCFPPQIVPAGTACGRLSDLVYLVDNGDGTCVKAGTANGQPIGGSCTEPIFQGFSTCPTLNASLVLIFRKASASGQYTQNMQGWLNGVGIGNPRIIFGVVTIYVDHLPNPIPPMNPVFLTGLEQVGAIVFKECMDCFKDDTYMPGTPAVQSLRGFSSLRQFRDFRPGAGFLGSLFIFNTAMTDLTSFGGLACPPGQTQIVSNRNLVTLAGLERVSTAYWTPGASVYITNNAQLIGSAGLAPIKLLAGCPGSQTTSPQASRPNINTQLAAGVPCRLATWTAVCTFINAGICS